MNLYNKSSKKLHLQTAKRHRYRPIECFMFCVKLYFSNFCLTAFVMSTPQVALKKIVARARAPQLSMEKIECQLGPEP